MPASRVLVVDDIPDVAESLVMLLSVLGFDALAVTDPREAFRSASEFSPEVAVLDLRMPGMDGADVARQLKTLPTPPKVVIYSGSQERRDELAALGFNSFVVKPGDPKILVDLIQQLAST